MLLLSWAQSVKRRASFAESIQFISLFTFFFYSATNSLSIPKEISLFPFSRGQPRKNPELKMAMAMTTGCGSSRWSMVSLKSALPPLTSTASSVKLPCRRRPTPTKCPQLVRSYTSLSPVNPLHSLGFSGKKNSHFSLPPFFCILFFSYCFNLLSEWNARFYSLYRTIMLPLVLDSSSFIINHKA